MENIKKMILKFRVDEVLKRGAIPQLWDKEGREYTFLGDKISLQRMTRCIGPVIDSNLLRAVWRIYLLAIEGNGFD